MENTDLQVQRTFQLLSRQQLEIYARELREHITNERRLRRELEERNRILENRVRELTALNQLFQQHLRERFETLEAYRHVCERIERLAQEADDLVNYVRSRYVSEEDNPNEIPNLKRKNGIVSSSRLEPR